MLLAADVVPLQICNLKKRKTTSVILTLCRASPRASSFATEWMVIPLSMAKAK
uniref:Uncharacterized protein n=1 Tax=Arundo donax TaxID=35708 RepID=A0A0A8Y394_ARUDO